MTGFRIEEVRFNADQLAAWAPLEPRFRNWPVVYTLDGAGKIYVGESLNVAARFRQHLASPQRSNLTSARVVVDDSFNKSVCLDLESFLIRLFAGDGQFDVLNGNHGITDSDYYRREDYRHTFRDIFDELRERGAFSRPIHEIENTDLFKLSPFKALTQDQAIAVDDILSGLFQDLQTNASSRIVIQGAPGTGKTVVGIFLAKLLMDIKHADVTSPPDSDSLLSEFFVPGYPELLVDFNVAMVVPQQSLRRSIRRVFRKTPGLSPQQVLSPFEVGGATQRFDLLIVDEAHRLNQRAAQAAGPLNKLFADINIKLFGEDDSSITQLDWIDHQSRHQIYLLDGAQAVRPADLPIETTRELVEVVRRSGRHYPLTSQMRVRAGDDYVGYVRGVLEGTTQVRRNFVGYDLRFFDDPEQLREAIIAREEETGLARLLAGFAWPWKGKHDANALDIHVGGLQLRWNATDVDWVNSPTSIDEVGSIHTIQGYDLNYAGVIIGKDLRYDVDTNRIYFDRENYHDPRGTTNNRMRGISYSDDDILQFVRNIYAVLLTRGMLGTYLYVCDGPLREHLRKFF
ncbi:DNA/RNA helicase domain-containing protein [Nocardioides piscis]|uniref:DUF2075 domain-containing protein n=1 Tax=Nocardioides piscis TaxID=2714938 RepID=A0A6G7YCU5_9ACTN|nr:DNA/RNA helicase domain-containing protein [Nocardioides piscis]QIK74590.1 DUF2075 domain-containing protein [Nocardioides piscis]